MIEVPNHNGVIYNFMPDPWLSEAEAVFKTFPATAARGGWCHGVDQKNLRGYAWFRHKFMNPLNEMFGHDVKLVFGMYLDISQPFGIHSDIRPVEGRPYFSCLIPCSVDNDPLKVTQATTEIYDGLDDGTGVVPENLQLRRSCPWRRGDLIWWDTHLFHSSGQFEDFASKQAIVIHTYV